jgi:hypothetical protein
MNRAPFLRTPAAVAAMTALILTGGVFAQEKIDYVKTPVRVEDPDAPRSNAGDLTDGYGAEPYPVSPGGWVRTDGAPGNGKPAAVIFDYGKPQMISALAHYFYVPGCRDHKWGDWLSGPSAFREVRISASDDGSAWKEVVHLNDLPPECPQMLKWAEPVTARYLKLEVVSLAPGAGILRSYEIETYVDGVPKSPISGDFGKAVPGGFPNLAALESAAEAGSTEPAGDPGSIRFRLPAKGLAQPLSGNFEIRINDKPVALKKIEGDPSSSRFSADAVLGARLDVDLRQVKAGLLVGMTWHGKAGYPSPKIDIVAGLDGTVTGWFIPEYYHYGKAPAEPLRIVSAWTPTRTAMIDDGRTCLAIVPDTDQSWVGFDGARVFASFPMRGTSRALLVAGAGDWLAGFRRVVSEVFDFGEPRQFSPVSQALFDQCRYLLSPDQWSDAYDTFRAFPGLDNFGLFYGMPYEVPALTFWEKMTGDPSIARRVDRIVGFALDHRLRGGPMAGAIFSHYTDWRQVEHMGRFLGAKELLALHERYPNEVLMGHDQANQRRLTSHNMGAVLWAITHVWRSRGRLDKDVLAGATDVADWMVRCQREDGSWPYGFQEDGKVSYALSDSGSIWNVWSLYRFGRLTGNPKYSKAAEKAAAYFKSTFTANHLYRGYWEDTVGENQPLGTAQGYEASIATLAFREMGDEKAMVMSARDCLRFVCTRTLESRTYETSYGGASEQLDWAPGTYIASTMGYAAHSAWRRTGDDLFRRFSGLAKGMGWWQYKTGSAFWLIPAIWQQPIEMLRERGRDRSFWAFWDSAQKIAFALPWLVDEVNRRSGDRIKIDLEGLTGKDDRGAAVAVGLFAGRITSVSGQVNWLPLKAADPASPANSQLALINHAEATVVIVESGATPGPASIRMFNEKGDPVQGPEYLAVDGKVQFLIPEQHMVIIAYQKGQTK